MRQEIRDNWYLDIDPDFLRREAGDGWVIFDKPGMNIRAMVYGDLPFDPELALRSFVGPQKAAHVDIHFRNQTLEVAGYAFKVSGGSLHTVTASFGRLMRLDFRYQDDQVFNTVVAIWHSLHYAPPIWARLCAQTNPPLVDLRDALEQGTGIVEAIEDAVSRDQVSEAMTVLHEAIKSDDRLIRISACDAIAELGHATHDILSVLRAMLRDDSVRVRASAATALVDLGESPASVVPAMIEGLQRREGALPKGEDRIQGACSVLSVPDRYYAAYVLSNLGEAARPAREVLLQHQLDESGHVRLAMAEALTNLGEPAEVVVPALLEALDNPNMSDRERMSLVRPLLKHGVPGEQVLPAIIRCLEKSADYWARRNALQAVRILGNAASAANDAVQTILIHDSGEWSLKCPAAQASIRIGGSDQLAGPVLLGALDDTAYEFMFDEIIYDLGHMTELDAHYRDRILVELNNEVASVRCAAAFALARHNLAVNRSLTVLRDILENGDPESRWRAVVVLGQLGSTAAQMVDRLIQLVHCDECRDVQLAGFWSLRRIGWTNAIDDTLLEELTKDADKVRLVIYDGFAY